MSWLAINKQMLRKKLEINGAILFRNCPIPSPEAFETMLDTSEFVNMPYVGGAAPRSKVTQRRVITANESPASEKIPFHHEMAQVANPPGYVFFYCDLAAKKGGATGILHSNEIYNQAKRISPEFTEAIEKSGVKYVRVMPEDDDSKSPIGRSWKSTFNAASKDEAEHKMKEMGMEWEWLPGGNLRTITATLPAIRTDRATGKKTFYNSIIAAYMGWQDERNDRTKAVMTADGKFMDGKIIEKIADAMDDYAVKFPWQKGDALWLNNNLVLHSRYPFEGSRKILASIALEDQDQPA